MSSQFNPEVRTGLAHPGLTNAGRSRKVNGPGMSGDSQL